MHLQQPIKELEIPENCPICFEDSSVENYIQLTCGHYLHKECMITCGRPTCPVCKQFVIMPKHMFLRLRIKNLTWKLENMDKIIDSLLEESILTIFKEFDTLLLDETIPTGVVDSIDVVLMTMNRLVQHLYYC
jgi:Ring finger domain